MHAGVDRFASPRRTLDQPDSQSPGMICAGGTLADLPGFAEGLLSRGAEVLGAICLAPAILARAGVLKDKAATAYESALPDLKKGGARVSDKAVVVDGKLVTGNGPKAAEEFAEKLVQVIAGE